MHKHKRSLTALTSLLFLLTVVVALPHIAVSQKPVTNTPAAPASPTPTSVNVLNTPGVNQSGTWNVGINGTPNVNVANNPAINILSMPGVTQSGAWSVGINNTPSVNVANAPSVNIATMPNVSIAGTPIVGLDAGNNTVKIDTSTPLPVRTVDNPALRPLQVSFPAVVTNGFPTPIFMAHVPAGSCLVIEQITTQGSVTTGGTVQMFITTTAGGSQANHGLVVGEQHSVGGQDYFTGTQLTRLYADPNSDVFIQAQGINGGGSINFSLSGYLVNLS
jgi:hypothetical protein